MKRMCLMMLVLGLVAGAGPLWALDTSPYLIGFLEHTAEDLEGPYYNEYEIVNPTTKPLDIWMVWYRSGGPPCSSMGRLPPNAMTNWGVGMRHREEYDAVKFFAFPAGTRKFDPNAVIYGYQRRSAENAFCSDVCFLSEANLTAVTINSSTIGEFAEIPWDNRCGS
jgi:hypothetical protein